MGNDVLIVIIPGVSGLLTAVITSIIAPLIIKRFHRANRTGQARTTSTQPQRRPLPPGSQTKRIRSLTAMSLVVGVFVGYLLAVNSIHSSSCLPLAPSSATITSPTPGSKVTLLTTIQGTHCHIQNGQELWVFLKPDDGTSYYPQDNVAVISSDGKWIANARIGLENKPEGFDVIIVSFDQDGSAAIERYLKQSGPQQGFQTLPRGALVMSLVHVMRT